MTEETLRKAQKNRHKRLLKLRNYNMVNDIINHLGADFSSTHVIYNKPEEEYIKAIPTNEDEFRVYMVSIRERLDKEIAELDKEFAKL